jgi:hypothetical protein
MGAPSCGFIGTDSNNLGLGIGMELGLRNKFVDRGRGSNSRWCQRNSFTSAPKGDREKSKGFVNVTGASLTGASRLIAASARPGWRGRARLLKSKIGNRFSAGRPRLFGNAMPRGMMVVSVHLRVSSGKGLRRLRAAGASDHPVPITRQRSGGTCDPRVLLVNTLFWKILVTRVQRKIA